MTIDAQDAMCEDKENLDDQVMSSGTLAKIHPKEKDPFVPPRVL